MGDAGQDQTNRKPGDPARAALIETPSGKTAADENFPVGSWLLPARLRPHVAAFYAFARAADDIADNPALAPDDKIRRLDGFAAALAEGQGDPAAFAAALRLRESLALTHVSPRHGLDLLRAFRQDATKCRYTDWADLLGYCALSAAPVGRYLLDLHGESPDGYAASDALCNALQILNHLQDCGLDYQRLDRVYLPLDWLAAAGEGVDALVAARASPGLRRVIDQALDGVDGLLATAASLPGRLTSRRLAMESAVIFRLARRLSARLRAGDPIAGRVALSRIDFALAGIGGIALAGIGGSARVLLGRPPASNQRGATTPELQVGPTDLESAQEYVTRVVCGANSSFGLGMRILPAERRLAMFAIYAFGREVDDIADDPGLPADKLAGLAEWRAELDRLYQGHPTRPTTRALLDVIRRYHLPKTEFIALIEGMEMDAAERMRAPDWSLLDAYCRRAAGAVGLLSLPVFGADDSAAPEFALALGDALQLTNILRDIAEDAERDRLYLPRELLLGHGIDPALDPAAVLTHPALPAVCRDLAKRARERFAAADAALARCRRRRLRPALLMMGIYERILDRLDSRGWPVPPAPLQLSKREKLWAAIGQGLLRPRWQPST